MVELARDPRAKTMMRCNSSTDGWKDRTTEIKWSEMTLAVVTTPLSGLRVGDRPGSVREPHLHSRPTSHLERPRWFKESRRTPTAS